MDLELAGKTALVTGGSRGIGRAVAERLAAEGCSLHLAARSAEDLARARDELNARYGAQVAIHAADLSEGETMRRLAMETAGIDILVNNAGAIPAGGIEDVDESTWRRAWDLKVFGYVNLTRDVFGAMTARGHGVIINVIGAAGERPTAGYIAGSMGNASLMAMTTALGAAGMDRGVRVVGVNSGLVETDRMVTLSQARAEKKFGDRSRWRELLTNLPQGRAGRPEEIADLVAFLASVRASWITGTVVTIDGGATKRASL